jgi:hypothetical protein
MKNIAIGRGLFTIKQAHQGRLTGTTWAHQEGKLAKGDMQVYIDQSGSAAVVFVNVLQSNHA